MRISGLTAGFLGRRWDPQNFTCDPQAENFVVKESQLPGDLPPFRLSSRTSLLNQIDRYFHHMEQTDQVREYDRLKQEALGILTHDKARAAFALEDEPTKTRGRYGTGKWGQSVLLARRLRIRPDTEIQRSKAAATIGATYAVSLQRAPGALGPS